MRTRFFNLMLLVPVARGFCVALRGVQWPWNFCRRREVVGIRRGRGGESEQADMCPAFAVTVS